MNPALVLPACLFLLFVLWVGILLRLETFLKPPNR